MQHANCLCFSNLSTWPTTIFKCWLCPQSRLEGSEYPLYNDLLQSDWQYIIWHEQMESKHEELPAEESVHSRDRPINRSADW